MARTFRTHRFCVLTVCCCVILLLWIDGAHAADNSSSSDVTSNDQSDGDNGESTVEKGMRPFYDMVRGFLGVVQPKKLTDQAWLNLTLVIRGDFDTEELKDWKNWAEYLVGFVVCAAVGVLFFLVVPIVGLIFCCCRCCGKCGGKQKPHDPKHAGCKRTTYCTLLLVFNTLALAGVVCAFLSNQILYDKLQNVDNVGSTGKLIRSADLVNEFTNDTIDEIEEKVLNVFEDTSVDILEDITDTAKDAIDDVLDSLNAINLLAQSRQLASDVDQAKDSLTNIADQLNVLSTQGSELADNLTAIRTQIDAVCSPASLCPGYDPSKYALSANFSGLDTLSTEANNVAKSLNLSQDIIQAEETINNTKINASDTVDTSVDEARGSINTAKQNVRDAVNDFTEKIQSQITAEVDKFRSDVMDTQEDISKYSKYIWYGGIGISCFLLLVVVLYYIGILFGLCGERPGFGAQCCNTGTGANFLLASVGFTFLLGWLIMLVCVILFITGGPLYTELCRYFVDHNPQDLKPFNDAVMDAVDFQKSLFEDADVDLNLVDILEECKDNEAIYYVLRLEYMVNITEKTDLTDVRTELDKLKTSTFNIPDVTILTSGMNQSISDFADSGLSTVPFETYFTEINKDLTEGHLPDMANQLRSIADSSTSLPQPAKDTLNSVAHQLDELHTNYVVPMQMAEESLKNSLTSLQVQAESGIKNSTDALLNGLQTAENDFNSQKNTLIQTQVAKLADGVLVRVEGVVQDIRYDINNNIGQCRPIYDSFYSASDAACVAALEPLNGLWFSIGWCLFFFIPALIFAVKLAGLYRREHEERDFDDPNFSQYVEGKQDGIPLTSRDQSGRERSGGMANRAYQDDSYMGPSDYPNYKGGAVNSGYQHDGYMQSSPPPYGARPGGHGEINPPAYTRDQWQYSGAPYAAPPYPTNAVSQGGAPHGAY